jgi:hypothetical protein
VQWQGHVTGAIAPDLLIIELFSWVAGEPPDEIIVRLADLISPVNGQLRFAIYDDDEVMNKVYRARFVHHRDEPDA